MDRWGFSWDLSPGPPQKINGGDNPSRQTWKIQIRGEDTAAGKGKAVKLAKGGVFQLQMSLFQRSRNTPMFIGQVWPYSFAPSHCPYRRHRTVMKIPINPHYFRSSVQRYYYVEIEIIGKHNCCHFSLHHNSSLLKILRLSDGVTSSN